MPQGGPASDDELMKRYARGDAAAFEALYRRYEAPVYGFCLRYLGDPDRAADAFQETFVRLIDARDDYEPRGRFRSWLFTVARRVCVDHSRAASDRRASEVLPDELPAGAPGQDVERQVAARDEAARLLATLPAAQREVILLSRYHGFTYAEIADLVGSTEAAVKQQAYRALTTLRAQFAGERST